MSARLVVIERVIWPMNDALTTARPALTRARARAYARDRRGLRREWLSCIRMPPGSVKGRGLAWLSPRHPFEKPLRRVNRAGWSADALKGQGCRDSLRARLPPFPPLLQGTLVVKLAILHQTLPVYMEQDPPEESKHLDVVLKASDLDVFREGLRHVQPRVLVLDLPLLGSDPQAVVQAMEDAVKPQLTMIVYAFAKWDLVEALRGDKRHVLRAPISVRTLRANLIHLIVSSLLKEPEKAPAPTPAPVAREPGVPSGAAPERRFDDVQLAHLQEIIPNVDCECPNQVADLVLALNAFENYSHECKNRNAADAKVHAMLARATGHARAMMELAMTELCEFEKIDIKQLSHRENEAPESGTQGSTA
jgi:hypothetical protein